MRGLLADRKSFFREHGDGDRRGLGSRGGIADFAMRCDLQLPSDRHGPSAFARRRAPSGGAALHDPCADGRELGDAEEAEDHKVHENEEVERVEVDVPEAKGAVP